MTSRPTKHNISGDTTMSPETRDTFGQLRGTMIDAAEEDALPPRFIAEPHMHQPAMHILDTETGRQTVVSLYAYAATRKALNDLFGPEPALNFVGEGAVYGMAARIEGQGYTLILTPYPSAGQHAYRIEVGGQAVGWLRRDSKTRWQLVDYPQDRWEAEAHPSLSEAIQAFETNILPNFRQ